MTSQAWKNADKLDSALYVEAYRDGAETDADVWIAALTAAVEAAPCTLIASRKTYVCPKVLGTFNLSGVIIEGRGAILDFSSVPTSPAVTMLHISGSYSGTPISLTSNAAAGQKTVALTSAGLAAGQMVRVYSDTIFDPGRTSSKYGELNFIDTVPDAASVTCALEMMATYTTADSAKLQVVTPVQDCEVRDLKLYGPAGNDGHIGIKVTLGLRVRLRNVRSFDMDSKHIDLIDCCESGVDGSHFQESNSNTLGYGVCFTDASQDCWVKGSTFRKVRHAWTTSNQSTNWGIVRRIEMSGNDVQASAPTLGGAGGDACDTHAAAEFITMANNRINGSTGAGINVECRSAKLVGNTITNTAGNGITVQNYTGFGGDYQISGNDIGQVAAGQYGIAVVAKTGSIVGLDISGNTTKIAALPIYLNVDPGMSIIAPSIVGNPSLNSAGNTAIQVKGLVGGSIVGNGCRSLAIGIQLEDCSGTAVGLNSIELTGSGATGYGVRAQGTSDAIIVASNPMRHTGTIVAAAAVSFLNTTVTKSTARGNTAIGFTAGTVFNIGTGVGNAESLNIT